MSLTLYGIGELIRSVKINSHYEKKIQSTSFKLQMNVSNRFRVDANYIICYLIKKKKIFKF